MHFKEFFIEIKAIILDSTRSVSISSFLKACKLSNEEIITKIKQGDLAGIDLNLLRANLPTEKDVRILLKLKKKRIKIFLNTSD